MPRGFVLWDPYQASAVPLFSVTYECKGSVCPTAQSGWLTYADAFEYVAWAKRQPYLQKAGSWIVMWQQNGRPFRRWVKGRFLGWILLR